MSKELAKLIARRCYLTGNFKLSSGCFDNNYIDLWLLLTDGDFLRGLAWEISSITSDWKYDVVGGPELAALPIANAVVLRNPSSLVHRTFLVRKQLKGHGTNKLVEGVLQYNDRALIVEDVSSTGRSVLLAIHTVQSIGVRVVGVVTVVDREEGAQELLMDHYSLELRSLTTLREIREEVGYGSKG